MTGAERLAAAKQWHKKHVKERAELETKAAEAEAKLAESTETLRTVANLFSASIWKILPTKIKAYFEAYREA